MLTFHKRTHLLFLFVSAVAAISCSVRGQNTVLSVHTDTPKPISTDLFGVFFEDLSYAADGGLYAEMVQNRSFEYSAVDHTGWDAFTGWELVQRNGGRCSYIIGDANPLHSNNPHYIEMNVDAGRDSTGAGLMNTGFDGMVFKAGEQYDFSVFARQQPGRNLSLTVRLESPDGTVLGQGTITGLTSDWEKYAVAVRTDRNEENGRLVLLAHGGGVIYMDMISLFPQHTFRGRSNGLRADLAQAIADLKPRFMRFPGGCLVHGDGLNNLYRWKDTIGPVHQRKEQKNIWRYHQTMGLGYFEYFQFCEDIGAKPLPVVPAGVSCQNTDRYWGVGQQAIDMKAMPAYIQEVLDLIEWANGPADSEWGSKRAAAGHPEPFGLEYLGVGNEDAQTPAFRERFEIIYKTVKEKYPDIKVIGTVGPAPDGDDYKAGWKYAGQLGLEMVDEHFYRSPDWFLQNLDRYDSYDRSQSRVYIGEYAAHDRGKRTTLRSALAEAAMMTAMERNGDVVHMASYAPMLAKIGHVSWNPDLIYFTNTRVIPTINYYVQKMFSTHAGNAYLPVTFEGAAGVPMSAVFDSRTGDVILKIVNPDRETKPMNIQLNGMEGVSTTAEKTILSGDPAAVNTPDNEDPLVPITSTMSVSKRFEYQAPPHSLTVIRIHPNS